MSKVIIAEKYLEQLAELDYSIHVLNGKKIKLLFEALAITVSDADFAKLLDWQLILVTVPDKQMAVQLNKLSAYIANLKFVIDAGQPIFTLMQGQKQRRVWKER